MPNFAGARTLPARPRDGEVRGTKSETREGKSLERVAGRPRSDVQGRICYQVTNIPCVYIYIYVRRHLFGTKLKYILCGGPISFRLLKYEVMSQYLVQTTLVADHTISFRLL